MTSISSGKVETTTAVQSTAIDPKSSQSPGNESGKQEKVEEQPSSATSTDEPPRLSLARLSVLSIALGLGFFLNALVSKPMLEAA